MERSEFVKEAVLSLEQPLFDSLKTILNEYVTFSFLSAEQVTSIIWIEKLCDYLEKLEIKTNRSFDRIVDAYMNDLDSVISAHIAKTQPAKKGEQALPPRSRRYYEKTITIKNSKELTVQSLIDYTRIMMCLYAAYIKDTRKEIDNFDFSAAALHIDSLLDSIRAEKTVLPLNLGKIDRFNLKDCYSPGSGTFVLLVILLHAIMNTVIEGGCDFEH